MADIDRELELIALKVLSAEGLAEECDVNECDPAWIAVIRGQEVRLVVASSAMLASNTGVNQRDAQIVTWG